MLKSEDVNQCSDILLEDSDGVIGKEALMYKALAEKTAKVVSFDDLAVNVKYGKWD